MGVISLGEATSLSGGRRRGELILLNWDDCVYIEKRQPPIPCGAAGQTGFRNQKTTSESASTLRLEGIGRDRFGGLRRNRRKRS
jgi:hypothetical protein